MADIFLNRGFQEKFKDHPIASFTGFHHKIWYTVHTFHFIRRTQICNAIDENNVDDGHSEFRTGDQSKRFEFRF